MTLSIFPNQDERPLHLPRYRHRAIKSLVKQLRRRERDAYALSTCRQMERLYGVPFSRRNTGHGTYVLLSDIQNPLAIVEARNE